MKTLREIVRYHIEKGIPGATIDRLVADLEAREKELLKSHGIEEKKKPEPDPRQLELL